MRIALGPVNTNAQSFDNESEHDETGEERIEFIEAAKHTAVTFEAAEKSFDFVSTAINQPVIFPRCSAIRIGWHYGMISQLFGQTQGFISFISTVHDQVATCWHGAARS